MKILGNLALFLLGIASATVWFQWIDNKQSSTINDQEDLDVELFQPKTDAAGISADSEGANIDYRQIIRRKNRKIAKLDSQIAELSNAIDAMTSQADRNEESGNLSDSENSKTQLKRMSMEDFEQNMKDSFVDRFKGIILEIDGEQLESMKKSFNSSSDKNEWSNQYESDISEYLAANNPNGEHFVQELSCNTNICRLEINTNDDESWNSLYASMTEQAWYKTITLEENSGYPGNHIYYLPSINN